MSHVTHASRGLFLLMLAAMLLAAAPGLRAQQQERKVRIGIFDSRKAAVIRLRSGAMMRLHDDLVARREKAVAAKDSAEMKRVDWLGPMYQAQMHDQVFGKGSVNMCFTEWKDVLAAVAKERNLSLIVSKWETAWVGADVEFVDVTDALVAQYKPDDTLLKMLTGFDNNPPVEDALFMQD